jgi:hypothetical protein
LQFGCLRLHVANLLMELDEFIHMGLTQKWVSAPIALLLECASLLDFHNSFGASAHCRQSIMSPAITSLL